MKRRMFTTTSFTTAVIGLTALLTVLPLSQPAAADNKSNWDVKVTIDVDWGEVWKGVKKAAGWLGSRFNKHPTRQAIADIGGKKVVVIPVRRSGETRVTDNINFDPAWRSKTKVRIYVANVPSGSDPRAMTFQQKYDESFGSDPNIGPIIAHGDLVDFEPGHDRYFAKRSDTVYAGAYIVVVEDGLTIGQVNGLQGIKIR